MRSKKLKRLEVRKCHSLWLRKEWRQHESNESTSNGKITFKILRQVHNTTTQRTMTLCGKIVRVSATLLHDMTQSANEPAASAMEYGQVVNLFHVAIHGDYFKPYRIECFDGAELLGQVLCQLWLKKKQI